MAFEFFEEGEVTCKCGQVHRVVCEIDKVAKSARVWAEAVEAAAPKKGDKPVNESAWPYNLD